MKKYPGALLLLVIFTSLLPQVISAQEIKPTVAVMDLQLMGLDEDYTRVLTDRLGQEIFSTDRFLVLERAEMEAILVEQGFSMAGCVSNECIVEAGRMLSVQQMVAGSIGRVGNSHTISLRLIDVETGEIKNAVTVDCTCPIEEVLSRRLGEAARKLAGVEVETEQPVMHGMGTGTISVNSEPVGGQIYVDEMLQEDMYTPADVELSVGLHTIKVVKGDSIGSKPAMVSASMLGQLDITLELGRGQINVTSVPDGGNVMLDNLLVGTTPMAVDTTAGMYRVQVALKGYVPWSQDVYLHRDQSLNVHTDLTIQATLVLITPLKGQFSVRCDGMNIQFSGTTRFFVTPGPLTLKARLTGYHPLKMYLDLLAGEEETLNLVPKKKRHHEAVLRSLLIPGWGQRFAEHKEYGWLITLVQAGTVGYAVYAYTDYLDVRDDYDEAKAAYAAATSAEELATTKAAMFSAHDDLNDATSRSNTATYMASAVYLFNVVDVVFLPGGKIRFAR